METGTERASERREATERDEGKFHFLAREKYSRARYFFSVNRGC